MSVKRATKPAFEHTCDQEGCAVVAITAGHDELPLGWRRFTAARPRLIWEFCGEIHATAWMADRWEGGRIGTGTIAAAQEAPGSPQRPPRPGPCSSRCPTCGRACARGVVGHAGYHEDNEGDQWGDPNRTAQMTVTGMGGIAVDDDDEDDEEVQ